MMKKYYFSIAAQLWTFLVMIKIRSHKILFSILISLCSVSLLAQVEHTCGTTAIPEEEDTGGGICNTSFVDFELHHTDDMVPQGITRNVKIRTNVVLLQRQIDPNSNEDLGNFSPSTNADHKEYLDDIFSKMNAKLATLEEESCFCTTAPEHYDNIHLEFVPTYIEIQNEFYWDHLNDPNPNTLNSRNKPYLNEIHQLIIDEGYEPGFDVFITTNKILYDIFVLQDGPYDPNVSDPYDNQWYSSTPPLNDLTHHAFWHAPDMYLDYYYFKYKSDPDPNIREWYVNQRETKRAGDFIHEYGHYFNLGHLNACVNNIMNGPGGPRTSFTGCQVREIYETLMTKNVRQFVICEDVLDKEYELVVDTDEEWNNNIKVYSNIRIKTGATLDIQCELHLHPKAKIFVERGARLILSEGAIIDNGGECLNDPAFRWEGIKVEGNNSIPHNPAYASENYVLSSDDHGIVLIQPEATLRDANIGIRCIKDEASWNANYWGAFIRTDQANFINNKTSISFMRFNFLNGSEILDSKFEGGDYGITNWRSDHVRVQGCEFKEHKINGIYSINAGMRVWQNTFTGITDAIEIENSVLLNQPYSISNNSFLQNGVGVKAVVSNNLLVNNNDFDLGLFGVSLLGMGQAVIQNNKFENLSAGVDLQSAGNDYNPVGCNIFRTCSFGINPSGDNRGLQYFNNQNQEGNFFDAYIQSDANGNQALLTDQGSNFDRRLNTFSIAHTNHFFTENNENQNFTYFAIGATPNDITIPQCYIGDPSCQDPFNFELDMSIITDPIDINLICGDIGNETSPEPPCPDCGIGFFVGGDDGEGLIGEINGQIVPGTIGFTVSDAKVQKDFSAVTQQYVFNNDYEGLETYLNQFGDYFLPFKHSIAVHQENYPLAETLLDQIGIYDGWESFVLPQKVYLNWAQDNDYLPTEEELNTLQTYANQDDPMAGFARSVLNIVTKEKFDPSLPDIPGLERRIEVEKRSVTKNWVYPNPIKDVLVLEVKDDVLKEGKVKVTDAIGRLIWENTIRFNEQTLIKTSDWPRGVYFVEVLNASQRRAIEKVIKQ